MSATAPPLDLAAAYVLTSWRYAVSIRPGARRELAQWLLRAHAIPDPVLRSLALAALRKRGNMEGAALFAVLAPGSRRHEAVRALVAFQAVYNYLDMLAEQPSADPEANARQLHRALMLALDAGVAPRPSPVEACYSNNARREDGGYLLEMVEACRRSLATLPSYPQAARSAQGAAARIVAFQSLNLGDVEGEEAGLRRWASERIPPGSKLAWWELAAAAGSSLPVHVVIGISAAGTLDAADLASIERAYFPAIGALHSLLDSLIDTAEDEREGQPNLMSHYASSTRAAARLCALARTGAAAVDALDDRRHKVILIAMVSHYLSMPTVRAGTGRAIADSVIDAVGPIGRPAVALFRAWRRVSSAS
jgi:tetraprenyl-beta-curcumene synthase